MPKISIIIVHFKDVSMTRDCLKSLDKIIVKGFEVEIILVNNGSESIKGIFTSVHNLQLMDHMVNLGFAGGNNLGIIEAIKRKSDFVLLLNNDTFVDQNFLIELVDVANSRSEFSIFGPKIYFAKGYEFHRDRYDLKDLGNVLWWAGGSVDWNNVYIMHRGIDEIDEKQYDTIEEMLTITGTAMFIRTDVFKTVGYLDEKFFLYFEESDFCERAKRCGFRMCYVPGSKVFHRNSGSSGSGSTLHDYYLTRNRLVFGFRYAPLRTKIALIKESLRLMFTGRPWQKRGIVDFFTSKLGKGSYVSNG